MEIKNASKAKNPTRWLSKGFETLVVKLESDKDLVFDVVIVGSGYGGSIAASQLSRQINGKTQKPLKICLLERGNEYLPGMFPKDFSELPRHIRFSDTSSEKPKGSPEGLLDFRLSRGINTILGNGLGGGSLVNAGVMEIPRNKEIRSLIWPDSRKKEIKKYYKKSKILLGATVDGEDNNLSSRKDFEAKDLKKYSALRKLASVPIKHKFRESAITVCMNDRTNKAGTDLKRCILCGDCATGCNHNAKESLDLSLLPIVPARYGQKA